VYLLFAFLTSFGYTVQQLARREIQIGATMCQPTKQHVGIHQAVLAVRPDRRAAEFLQSFKVLTA
jgi:hypothetical protein